MPGIESYPLECPCGTTNTVGVHQCGLVTTCPKCRQSLRVPDLKTLRLNAGDPYPTLSRIRKIQKAIVDRLPPFDGRCLNCHVQATMEVPIVFREARETFVTSHGGFRLQAATDSRGSRQVEDAAEVTEIPLALCQTCLTEFQQSRQTGPGNRTMQFAGLMAVAAVFQFVFQMWVVTLLAVLMFIGYWHRWRKTALGRELKRPTSLDPWLARVPWLQGAMQDSLDYELEVGAPRTLR